MVNNHTLPAVFYTCAQQYQPDRSSHVQPILFPKATQRLALGMRVDCATMHCLGDMAVSMRKVLAIPQSWYRRLPCQIWCYFRSNLIHCYTVQHFGWKVFSTRHCKLFVSSCKRAFDEQFVFLYSAFRCTGSRFRFIFSALSSLISWGLVEQYRLWIVIF